MFLKEHYLPRLADRESRNKWEKDGSNDVVKRAKERVKEILRTHQPTPLSDDVRKKLDFIVEEAKRKKQSD